MSDLKTHTVMVEVEVEGCEDLDQANDHVSNWLNGIRRSASGTKRVLEAEVQTYFETDNQNQRVFYLHPQDTTSDYDTEEYARGLEREREEDNKA